MGSWSFNQEKDLVGAFSVIVKRQIREGSFPALPWLDILGQEAGHSQQGQQELHGEQWQEAGRGRVISSASACSGVLLT